MKDARGHGSNGPGSGSGFADTLRAHLAGEGKMFGGGVSPLVRGSGEYPERGVSSNAAAAQALFSGLKSTMAPVHDSMAGRASNPTSAPDPTTPRSTNSGVMKADRTPSQEINRNLVLKTRFGLRGT